MTNYDTAYEAALRSGDRDLVFKHLIDHKTAPLTDAELAKLIALRPAVWGQFADYIGTLDQRHQAAAGRPSPSSRLG